MKTSKDTASYGPQVERFRAMWAHYLELKNRALELTAKTKEDRYSKKVALQDAQRVFNTLVQQSLDIENMDLPEEIRFMVERILKFERDNNGR